MNISHRNIFRPLDKTDVEVRKWKDDGISVTKECRKKVEYAMNMNACVLARA